MADKAYEIECSNFRLFLEIKKYLDANNIKWTDQGIGPFSKPYLSRATVMHISTGLMTLKNVYEIESLNRSIRADAFLVSESKR